jgi:hypothetical protein
MGDTTPSTGGAYPVVVAGESWTLTLIKVGGPVLAGLLTLVSSIIAMFLTDRMPEWMAALPILAGLNASIIAAAFAGPAIKRQQEAPK